MTPNPFTIRYAAVRRPGVALALAVVVLAVLASLLAGLSVRMAMVKRRQAYRVEYQRARYALDSAMKYALSAMPGQNIALIRRDEMPDFSDLFVLNPQQYQLYLEYWLSTATDEQIQKVLKDGALTSAADALVPLSPEMRGWLGGILGDSADPALPSAGDPNALIDPNSQELRFLVNTEDIEVPGPYGPPWPYAVKPAEVQIGSATVTITIEDENAKMPLSWTVTNREAANKQAEAALAIFCDWMGIGAIERLALQDQLAEIWRVKAFELNPSPILLPAEQRTAAQTPAQQTGRIRTTRTRAQRRRQTPAQTQAAAATRQRPAAAHATDFAKLFHSTLLDRQPLARPAAHTALPDQSPLRYLAMWGSQRINVNTAPRHVLEAALSFGTGDPTELAERIIQKRRQEPIKTLDELKTALYADSAAIENAKDYLTTTSNFFSIRVVSQSGNARAAATATVIKEGRTVERLAILYER